MLVIAASVSVVALLVHRNDFGQLRIHDSLFTLVVVVVIVAAIFKPHESQKQQYHNVNTVCGSISMPKAVACTVHMDSIDHPCKCQIDNNSKRNSRREQLDNILSSAFTLATSKTFI